jgi:uncharacterized protein (DUF736 family)
MTAIAFLTKQQDGSYKGTYDLLDHKGPLDMLPNRKKNAPNQPDFRLFSRTTDIGAAWFGENNEGEKKTTLRFAHPAFGPRVIWANLGPAEGQDDLDVVAAIWNAD